MSVLMSHKKNDKSAHKMDNIQCLCGFFDYIRLNCGIVTEIHLLSEYILSNRKILSDNGFASGGEQNG